MTRGAWLAILVACAAIQPAAADQFYREDLRVPMAAAGPRGLEAMLVRPSGSGRYPLALISHGAPRDGAERAGMSPYAFYRQAVAFAQHGFAALVVMRRGYGTSGGQYAEGGGPCAHRDYLHAAKASAGDLRAAIEAIKSRPDVSMQGMITVGVSAGGFASIALAADPPPGLAAAISFAGGRGSQADNDVCDEDALIHAFARMGSTSRIPTLWIYAQNDKFFRPDLAHRMHAAFTAAGGRAQFVDAPAFGSDGHSLFSGAIPVWTPMVDGFLHEQNLGSRDVAAPPEPAALPPPPRLSANGRVGFAAYLAAGPHKAFAVSPKGGFGYRTRLRSTDEARDQALAECAKFAQGCALYAIDDELAEKAGSGSR